jgi:hypothetical protein
LTAFAPEGAFEARVSGAKAENGGRAEKIYARYVGTASVEPVTASAPVTEPEPVTASAIVEEPVAIVGSVSPVATAIPPYPEHLQQVRDLSELFADEA